MIGLRHGKSTGRLFVLATVLALTCSIFASADEFLTEAASESEIDIDGINGFRSYVWGSDYEDIKAEISEDGTNVLEYDWTSDKSEDAGMDFLIVKGGAVAGYDADVNYGFSEKGLEVGCYDISEDFEETDYYRILDSYTEIYGEPFLEDDSDGWGRYALWVDDEHNFILIYEDFGEIIYSTSDNGYMDEITYTCNRYMGFDLLAELDKYHNTDGI